MSVEQLTLYGCPGTLVRRSEDCSGPHSQEQEFNVENAESVVGMLIVARDAVVVFGMVGAAGLAMWMLPWSNADLDETEGDLRALWGRFFGHKEDRVGSGQSAERVAA